MTSLGTATHHIVLSSIGASSITKLYEELQPQLPDDTQRQLIDDRVIIISNFDVRISKLVFDALSLVLGRERFAISYCDSVRFNLLKIQKTLVPDDFFFSSLIVYHQFDQSTLSLLKGALLSLGDMREFEFIQGPNQIHLFFVEFYDSRVAYRAKDTLQEINGVIEVVATDESHSTYFQLRNQNTDPLEPKVYEASWGPNDTLKLISAPVSKTTFMIKNIPNKYTQKLLVDQLNKTHYGQFDFLYLRIDFKNHCNVGYAFINFVNIDAIISFIEIYVGKIWPHFNSEKQCDLAYARVQGRKALIEKFKNSCVMDQDPNYRPKLYYTKGDLKGKEEDFPSPSSTATY